eukprot:TRINITY_DN41048_c0_g1_i1.p1 TRINITY_DN41048_c0_g1~~TRINITY_DN41048_c0_g1_i1.p1  ORF type:complete len:728 (+),score=132.01 TRINITY_DN41048_c0_g1_i1:30-2186(+)
MDNWPYVVGGVVAAAALYKITENQGAIKQPATCSYIVPNSADPARGLGEIHRHPAARDGLKSIPKTGERTMYETFRHGVTIAGPNPCLGTRPRIGTGADGKPIVGDFIWQTYDQVWKRAHDFGAGLMELDLVPEVEGTAETGKMRLLAFFSKNRAEWIIAEQGLFSAGGTTVPLYDTLGEETVQMIINETELTTVLTAEPHETLKVIHAAAHCPTLRTIIQVEPVQDDQREKAQKANVRLLHFEEVEAAGRAHPREPTPPSANAIATFCYTSGTTGRCKGALLTHANMVADMVAVEDAGVILGPQDVHLSYLPLAHSFERIIEVIAYYVGARVGFYQGDTLKLMADISALRPTVFPSVPRLLNRVYEKITQGAEQGGATKKRLFYMAYAAKQEGLRHGFLRHRFWDKLVFSKIAKKVGLDRCALIASGSAPIAPHVVEFLRIVFSCSVLEGYGQTENAAGASIQWPSDLTTGNVGGPLGCNDIRLVDVAEMGYRVTDKVHGRDDNNPGQPCEGRGEVCLKGHNVFKGYYKLPEQTAEAIDADGWLHTGDIGVWTPKGQLRIVDRKKNIFKLSQGEYIAPEKLENIFVKSPFVSQIFVYGDSFQSVLVAVVVPDHDVVRHWAKEKGLPADVAQLCQTEELRKAILDDIAKHGKEAKLNGFELVKDIVLDAQPFSMDNDLLTPTFKLKRAEAKKYYAKHLESMYRRVPGGVAGKLDLKQG